MSFPRYPEYKESGIEWLGEVPAHWALPKLKHLVRIRNGRDYKDVEVEEGGYPVIGSGGEFTRSSKALFEGESLLLGRKGTVDKPLYVNGAFWTVDTMFYTEIGPKAVARFLYYYALRFPFEQYSTNTALPSMAQEDLANIRLAVPGFSEQRTIAAFLDYETARIDALIEEQQRMIELLKEKRQTVISHAVTKGLDPGVPMKDSGVEWLGEVPAHWRVFGIKHACSVITDGAHVSPETEEGVYPFVSTRDVFDDQICFEAPLKTSVDSYKYLVRTGCRPEQGDVLFSKDGTVGRTVVVREDRDFVVASSLIIIRPDQRKVKSKFLDYLCKSSFVSGQVDGFVKGAGLPRLSIQNLMKVSGVFPPLKEQHLIEKYLDREVSSLDALMKTANDGVELLEERRSALISAAVTGKLDVRGWSAESNDAEADLPMVAEQNADYSAKETRA